MIPHWSFNAARPEQPEFDRQIRDSLRSFYQSTDSNQDLWFREYPNFWRGFVGNPDLLQNGALKISRVLNPTGNWSYTVDYRNESSGEKQHIRFGTTNDPLRSIRNEWLVDTYNTTADEYEHYSAVCRLDSVDSHPGSSQSAPEPHNEEIGQIVLKFEVNNRLIRIPSPLKDCPVIGGYALYDVIPRFASELEYGIPTAGFMVLEDMQSLLGPCEGRSAGTINFDPAGELRGVCVIGRGYPPTYWWVDSSDHVVIIATTWKTLVASSASPIFSGERQ